MTYWQERFIQLEEAQHNKSLGVIQGIDNQFRHAQSAIEGKINAWYQRFAKNNGISMAEAKRLLNSDELAELQWDVGEYIKHGRENAINQQWMRELENASAKVHINRLEALKLQCQQEAEKLYGNYTDAIDAHIADIYTGGYYHTAYELQKGVGVGSALNQFNSNLVDKVIHKPWAVDGRNFSDRIWTDKTRLINNLHNSLTKMCITGEAPDRAIREISQNMHVSRQQAARIVQTEAAAFSSMAQEDCYKDLNVEQFEVVSTLDSGTCHSCGSMDGNHFPMTEYQIGVTVPPFHPRCRCCTAPYFGDEYDNIGKRAARDEAGRTYDVPADMTYEEWKKSFVDGDIHYMSNSFRPRYGEEKNIQIDNLRMNVRQVKNSSFDMITDTENSRSKAVRLTEKIFGEIQKELPDTFEMPKIAVVDFEKQGLNANAIGGYHEHTGILFINSKYDTKQKILDFVNKSQGYFANNTEYAPYLHELGHKYYYDSIERLANKENISYSKARNKIDYDIYRYVGSKKDKYFLAKNISEYANTQEVTEICAEAFSVRESNKIAEIIIDLIGGKV